MDSFPPFENRKGWGTLRVVASGVETKGLATRLVAGPRQWVKAGEYPGLVGVSPIIIGINPMPEK